MLKNLDFSQYDVVIWIGSFCSENKFRSLNKLGRISASAFVSQRNLVEGIQHSFHGLLISLSAFKVQGRGGKFIPSEHIQHGSNYQEYSASSIVFPYLNDIWNTFSIKKEVNNILNKIGNKRALIFCYGLSYPYMKAAIMLKRRLIDSKVCAIIPDLPEYMSENRNVVYRLAKKLDYIRIKSLLGKFDKYICYTEAMFAKLNISADRGMVMEGSINVSELKEKESIELKQDDDKLRIMYSGALSCGFGLEMLLEAFGLLQGNQYELWITGKGSLDGYIKRQAEKDKRIKYYGFLESRQELIELQSKVDAFYTGRLPSQEYSKYCFPSKIFEYMTAGKVTMAFAIDGIPPEYFNYLVEIQEENADSICETICRIKAMDYLEVHYRCSAGMDFVRNQKNNVYQAQRILNFAAE